MPPRDQRLHLLFPRVHVVVALILVVAERGKEVDAIRQLPELVAEPVGGQQPIGSLGERAFQRGIVIDAPVELRARAIPRVPVRIDIEQIPLELVVDVRAVARAGGRRGKHETIIREVLGFWGSGVLGCWGSGVLIYVGSGFSRTMRLRQRAIMSDLIRFIGTWKANDGPPYSIHTFTWTPNGSSLRGSWLIEGSVAARDITSELPTQFEMQIGEPWLEDGLLLLTVNGGPFVTEFRLIGDDEAVVGAALNQLPPHLAGPKHRSSIEAHRVRLTRESPAG